MNPFAKTKKQRASRTGKAVEAAPAPRFEGITDDLPLTVKEGFRQFALAPRIERPTPASTALLAGMNATQKRTYDAQRRLWHANLGPYALRDYAKFNEQLWTAVDSNAQKQAKIRPSVLIDGLANLGKTTLLERFAREFYLDRISEDGRTSAGHEHIPVVYTTLTGNTTDRSLNMGLVDFFGLPTRGSAKELGIRFRNASILGRTELVIVDDVHFLETGRQAGVQLSNHLKALASESSATWLFAGVDVINTDLLLSDENLAKSQTARRWTPLTLTSLGHGLGEPRKEWHDLLKAITYDIELAHKSRTMLLDLDAYLFDRSMGVVGSLMSLIQRGCHLAIRRGSERLDRALFDEITIDHAAQVLHRRTAGSPDSLRDRDALEKAA